MWYAHQQKLIDEAPTQKLVAFGCGGGKTRTILKLTLDRGGTTLVVAPKTPVIDKTWEREMEKTGLIQPLTVISKEQFKKFPPPRHDNLVIDEAHFALGVTTVKRQRNKKLIPKASQIHEAIVEWIQKNEPTTILLATATPFPTPMALYAIACIFGFPWDYDKFRRTFYVEVPMLGRQMWIPKRDKKSKELLQKYAQKFGVFGRLEDFFDVPPQTHKEIHVGLTREQEVVMKRLPLEVPEPRPRLMKQHQVEQGDWNGHPIEENKLSEIEDLCKEFPKVLIFCRYTAQIKMYEAYLKRKFKRHQVLVLDGATKDRRSLMDMAEDPTRDTIVICQAAMGAAFELPSFRCTIFASMSYSYVDFFQALGRTLRANNLQKNLYVYLIAGGMDEAVLKSVKDKKDFNEMEYIMNV